MTAMRIPDAESVNGMELGLEEEDNLMKRKLHLFAATAATLLIPFASAQAEHPRISMQAARGRAMAIVPHGRITSAELEREHGQLIYSFDIRVPHRTGVEEIQISAIDGRLVSRTHEDPVAERREMRTEAREHSPR
jgi:hypothetical protein